MSKIFIKNLYKNFKLSDKEINVFSGLNLELSTDGITVILGKSGCGKTTLLRLISELDKDYAGKIDKRDGLRVGIVFQESRLMPWLTLYENITFGISKKSINKEKIDELLKILGLELFKNAYPCQLSGGMQQRVAIGRAITYCPDIILMDEPFAALDYFTRGYMQEELIKISQITKMEIIFVTHNIDEAMNIANELIILEAGKVKEKYVMDSKFPRDLLCDEMITLKKRILSNFNNKI
ncbi:ABC transporter ATP-binding protein [Fusobacterium sp. PH5-44]|uniref:ABC transporter ATP-binding protein n=1 Tax=unclassified Fusobacterium TaxID=2648384 RepID=UPI003D239740